MKTTAFLLLLAAAGSLAATAAAAQPTDPTTASIPLPPPSKDAMTLGAALEKRATAREFAPRELSVFLGSLKPDELAKALALPETSVPIFAQTIGKAPQP